MGHLPNIFLKVCVQQTAVRQHLCCLCERIVVNGVLRVSNANLVDFDRLICSECADGIRDIMKIDQIKGENKNG